MRNGMKVDVGEPVEVEIPQEFLQQLEALPDATSCRAGISFSAVDDEAIVRFYNTKTKTELSKLVGVNPYTGRKGCVDTTLRKRYLWLCEQRGIAP